MAGPPVSGGLDERGGSIYHKLGAKGDDGFASGSLGPKLQVDWLRESQAFPYSRRDFYKKC
jgi:hypothetical protein